MSNNQAMKPHIDVITLAVDDLDRALHFYRDLVGSRNESTPRWPGPKRPGQR